MGDAPRAVRLRIQGRVQGVGYREWMVDEARRLGLDGWVRNLQSGEVEAVVAGPGPAVDRLIEACRSGPRLARVIGVDSASCPLPEPGFHRRPTA